MVVVACKSEAVKRVAETIDYPSEQAMRRIEAEALPDNLGVLLDQAAAFCGDRDVAVFFDDDLSLTYRQLAEDTRRLASGLAALGVGFGDHVGVMLTTGIHYPITWLALARLGAVVVPLNPAYTAREVSFVIDDADIRFLIVDDAFLSVVEEASTPAGIGPDRTVVVGRQNADYPAWDAVLDSGDANFRPDRVAGLSDPVNIQYTSGTTGLPKGAIIPQGFWILRGKVWKTQVHFPIARNLISQPLHYIDGQAQFLLAVCGGGTAYVAARQSSSRFVDWLKTHRIEFCSLPEIIAKQLESADVTPQLSLKIAYAYSHRKDSYRASEARFACPLRQGYGMTEIGSALYVPVEADHMTGSGTVGIPSAFREVMVADENGNPVAPGVTGEIRVRGKHMFQGYYNRPDATAAAITVDGWLKTGDLGRQDEAGWFYYLGRSKDMVRRSSENISAMEVEEVLRGVDGVVEAAVLPVPDKMRGEEVKAYLRLAEGRDRSTVPPQSVLDHCRGNLAAFKVPRYLEYVDDFPRTPGHKIKKSDLVNAKPDLRSGTFDAAEMRWRA